MEKLKHMLSCLWMNTLKSLKKLIGMEVKKLEETHKEDTDMACKSKKKVNKKACGGSLKRK